MGVEVSPASVLFLAGVRACQITNPPPPITTLMNRKLQRDLETRLKLTTSVLLQHFGKTDAAAAGEGLARPRCFTDKGAFTDNQLGREKYFVTSR